MAGWHKASLTAKEKKKRQDEEDLGDEVMRRGCCRDKDAK